MDPDQLTANKTIYQASAGEIFFKNFLAGFGRAVGSLFIYIVFLIILFSLFTKYALPQIQPFITEYRQAIEAITTLNSTTKPGTSLDSNQYQQFIQDLNNSLPINK